MDRSLRTRGATLVEIMVTLGVLGVGIYGLAELVLAAQTSGAAASTRLRGESLARLKMAEISAAGANLGPVLASVPEDKNGERFFPPNGPEVFDQDRGFRWQAVATLKGQPPDRASVRVHVLRGATTAPLAVGAVVATVEGEVALAETTTASREAVRAKQ